MEKIRIDKWLWAARFYKTRSLATEDIGKGRITVNDQEAKPSREVKAGDTVVMRQGPFTRTVVVRGVTDKRESAPAQGANGDQASAAAWREIRSKLASSQSGYGKMGRGLPRMRRIYAD